jgi:hypothetical protein
MTDHLLETIRETMKASRVGCLLALPDQALHYFAQRDLLGDVEAAADTLWTLPIPPRLLKRQQKDGSWRYPRPTAEYFNHDLIETFRNLGILIEMYGFRIEHPAIRRAAEYIFSCQTSEGDIRGVLGTQYMPYYHAAILELLLKAGSIEDRRVIGGLDWLLSMRQDDGGWIVPLQALPASEQTEEIWSAPPIPPDRAIPSSHLATGMVLRALAAHPRYRLRVESQEAGVLLKRRFFSPDAYGSRRAPHYWVKFQFPYWWPNLLTSLDSLSQMGFALDDADIASGVECFILHQEPDGLWPTGYDKGRKAALMRGWVGLAIYRVLARLCEEAAEQ